jgi:hypothetical protein
VAFGRNARISVEDRFEFAQICDLYDSKEYPLNRPGEG